MPPEAEEGVVVRLLRRAVDVKPSEIAALGWSLLYVFSVLSAYYVIRPIRDEMGVQGGVNNLQWLFTGTLLAMLAVNPPFAALVRRLSRETFIAVAHRFFMANLLIFMVPLSVAWVVSSLWLGRRQEERAKAAIEARPATV